MSSVKSKAKLKETDILKQCKEVLKSMDVFYVRLEGSGKLYKGQWIRSEAAGMPDLLAVYCGVTYFIEVKTPTGKLTETQIKMLTRAQNQGVKVAVVRSAQGVIDLLMCKAPKLINKHGIPEYF